MGALWAMRWLMLVLATGGCVGTGHTRDVRVTDKGGLWMIRTVYGQERIMYCPEPEKAPIECYEKRADIGNKRGE